MSNFQLLYFLSFLIWILQSEESISKINAFLNVCINYTIDSVAAKSHCYIYILRY